MNAKASESAEMGDQPNHSPGQRDHEHEKNNAPFAPFPTQLPATRSVYSVDPRIGAERNVEPGPFRARALAQVLALPPGFLLGDARRFRDHLLEFLLRGPQLGFLLRELLFGYVEGRLPFNRTTKHARSLHATRGKEENHQRDNAKNDQGQAESETDLEPFRELTRLMQHV